MPYSPDSFTAGEVPTTAKWNKLWSNDADFDTRISQAAPVGVINPYGGSTAPTGWLICDGSAVSRTTYAALFAILGTTYGPGNGSTTFNLPDFKGKIPVGRDSGQTEFDVLGETGGAKTHTLSIPEMPVHSHTSKVVVGAGGISGFGYVGDQNVTSRALQSGGTAGSGTAHNNLQPYQVINYIVKT